MSFYRALVEMDLGGPVYPGDILTPTQLAGRDASILTRYGYAEFVLGDAPILQPKQAPKTVEKVEGNIPVHGNDFSAKAIVEKRGVWHQVFVNDKKVFHSRDEKEALSFAKEFNANN